MDGVRRAISIVTDSEEERVRIGELICKQLRGNQDFIDSNILVNYTNAGNEVLVFIYEECKYIPPITIF